MLWRRNWILRVHMYLLSWRKTNFFCVISILSLNQISKLINLHQNYTKNPYKSRLISNSSHCSTTILSEHITSTLTAVKYHLIRYSETTFSNNTGYSLKNIHVYYAETRPLIHCALSWYSIMTSLSASHRQTACTRHQSVAMRHCCAHAAISVLCPPLWRQVVYYIFYAF